MAQDVALPGAETGVQLPSGTLEKKMSDEFVVEGSANIEGSKAHALKQSLQKAIVLELPCGEGRGDNNPTYDVELLGDCPDCRGAYETVWGTCKICIQGLAPNKSGESVLFLIENFLLPAGFCRRGTDGRRQQ